MYWIQNGQTGQQWGDLDVVGLGWVGCSWQPAQPSAAALSLLLHQQPSCGRAAMSVCLTGKQPKRLLVRKRLTPSPAPTAQQHVWLASQNAGAHDGRRFWCFPPCLPFLPPRFPSSSISLPLLPFLASSVSLLLSPGHYLPTSIRRFIVQHHLREHSMLVEEERLPPWCP